MNILGIIGLGENPAACLLVNNSIAAFGEEERFTRIKSSHGLFPSRSVAWCLESNGLHLEDVDCIAFGWDTSQYPWQVGRRYARTYFSHLRLPRISQNSERVKTSWSTAAQVLLQWHPDRVRNQIREGLRAAGLRGRVPPIEYVPHHLAHAYSVYPLSGFDRAGILTIDGSGEQISTQLALGEGDSIRVIDEISLPHSLGWFYAAITQYLGLIPNRDEGKVMGLAALGEDSRADNKWIEPLSKILRIGDGSYEVDPTFTHMGSHQYGDRFTDALVDLITQVDPAATPVTYGEMAEADGKRVSRYLLPQYRELAWAAQDLLENAAISLARRLVRDHGVENLCIAGGVGLNCKMNGEILRRSGIKNIFVQPAANDSGAALGAAFYVAQQSGARIRQPLEHTFYGPEFSSDYIKQVLDGAKVNYSHVQDPADEAARRIAEGQIIGWFQGRMEFGARALGGRSILGNPLELEVKDRVNAEVKFREMWRPLCPSILSGEEHRYLDSPGQASFMTVAYDSTETCRRNVPGVVHVDGTVRPQVVTRTANARYHALIESFGNRSGHPIVLNTSFNVRGEPIICTPQEALRCLYSCGLDALVIDDFVLNK